jgi:uncharacterized protein
MDRQLSKRVFRNFIIGWLILGITAIPCSLASMRVLQTMLNAPITWLPRTEPAYQEWLAYAQRYKLNDSLFLSWPGCELESPELTKALDALQPLTLPDANGKAAWLRQLYSGQEVFRGLQQPPLSLSPDESINRLKKNLIGTDGRTTSFVLGLSERSIFHVEELLDVVRTTLSQALNRSEEEFVIVGPLIEMKTIDQTSQRSIDEFWLPSLALGIAVCFLFLRSLPLAVTVLAVALSGQGWSLAIVDRLGGEINAVLIVLLPLSFVLAVSSGIHLSNYYLDAWKSNHQIGIVEIVRAMRQGRWPCFLAALTTIIGLFSLWWVRLWPLQWFGTIGAVITAATLLTLWLILPGAMYLDLLWKRRCRRNDQSPVLANRLQESTESRWWLRFGTFVERRSVLVLFMFAILVLSLAAGIAKLKTTVSVERMLPDQHALKRQYAWFENQVAPINNAELEIEYRDLTAIGFHERFEIVREVHALLAAADSQVGVLSAVTFAPEEPEGNKVGSVLRRAAMRHRIEASFPKIEESGFAARVGDREYWRFSLRYPFFASSDSSNFLRSARQAAESAVDRFPGVQVRISGTTALADVAQELLFDGLIKSFLSTFLLIWLAMLLMLRSFSASAAAMLPNLFPFLALFGALGLSGEPLDIGIVMAASVALGIAVDDTIHFLTQYRTSLAAGVARREAVHQALRHCGSAMFQTTAICVATMAIYVLSDFVPTQRFSWLMCGLLVAALLGDLVMLPALLWTRLGIVFGKESATPMN